MDILEEYVERIYSELQYQIMESDIRRKNGSLNAEMSLLKFYFNTILWK